MVIDVITYNGEKELFDIRYNCLKDLVDEFIVCEARTTFSGRPKELTFNNNYERVKYFIIPDEYTQDEERLAAESPNTRGASHWKREFLQKESIKKALTHLDDDDIVYIGDCDEIWSVLLDPRDYVVKMKLDVYTYWLNMRSNEQFWGPILGRYRNIKNECLNHLRTNARKLQLPTGWHFTSMAPYLEQKLLDSYTDESYATPFVMENLKENIVEQRDFLGREFSYWINEADWPDYLKENREKYSKLIKILI